MYILLGIGRLDMGFDIQNASLGKSLPFVYKHRSRNVILSVENSAVILMRGCSSLMLLMNCSRLSFVSVHTSSSMYLFQCMGEGFVSERILDSSVPMKTLA